MVLTCTTIETKNPKLVDILKMSRTSKLSLPSLPFDMIEKLISSRLGVDVIPKSLTDSVYKKSDGQPYFAQGKLLIRKLLRIFHRNCDYVKRIQIIECL